VETSPGPKTEVRDYNGLPTLYIDGQPSAALFYMTYGPQAKHFKAFGDIGVDLSSFSCTANSCVYNGMSAPVWIAEDKFDYTQLDERLAMACAGEGVLTMPRVYSTAPAWWMDRYPEECLVYNTDVSHIASHTVKRVVSFASKRWRAAAAYSMRAMIEHIEQGPYANRIVGYHIAGGSTEEYFQWGSHSTYCADYSEVNRRAFGEWAQARYGTEEALREAWADPNVTFATVAIPTKDERDDSGGTLFYDPKTQQRVVDYYIFNGEMIVETIDSLAQAVKAQTQGTKMVGAFFGYVYGGAYTDRLLIDSGHLALASLLKRESVDFITSPTGYGERACGLGTAYFHSATRSIQRAGKLWLDENDLRTHLTGNEPIGTVEETIAVQQRETALFLTTGTGQWWFDMGGGWYDDPETMAAIKQLNAVAEAGLHADRRSGAEVAVVLDTDSLYNCPPDNTIANCFCEGLNINLNRVGAPVDRLLLEEALEGEDYKLYIMSGCFAMTEAQREKVRQKLLVAGKTVIWLYAPGYIRNGVASIDNIADLTGFKLRIEGLHCRMLVQTDADLPGPVRHSVLMGRHYHGYPGFFVVDPEAETWGYHYVTGGVGLACKQVNGANSIYCSAGPLDPDVVRDIAKFAGAHVYLDSSDASYFSRAFVGIHTRKAGVRSLHLPGAEPLYDVLQGQAHPAAATHNLTLAGDSTALYFRGTEAQWRELEAKAGH
jgi:hypothetical protein